MEKKENRSKKRGFRKRPTSDTSDGPRCDEVKRAKGRPGEGSEDVDPKGPKTTPAHNGVLSDEKLSSVAGGVPELVGLGPQWKGLETILGRSDLFRDGKKKDGK